MMTDHSDNTQSMPLHENVYAVSRDYGDFLVDDERYRNIGLYEGATDKVIPAGSYYVYLDCLKETMNYYWTGHGLLQADKDRATLADFSAHGSKPPIFGGYVDSHMGHFFIEVLARNIDFSACKDHPIVFLLLRERDDLKLFFKYCKFFGLDEKQIVIVDTPVIIPELYIPRPQFYITQERITKTEDLECIYKNTGLSSKHIPASFFSSDFLELHRKKGASITANENTVDKILYLSCVKSKSFFGEYIIHSALEAHGHTVIFPEEHSWESVISLVREHKHVVGLRGSAMHFLMFCRKKKKVTYFEHMAELSHNFHNLEQLMQNDMDYVQVRVVSLFDNEEARNLFSYNDIILLLKKLGIHDLPNEYYNYYNQVIVPYYKKHWQERLHPII